MMLKRRHSFIISVPEGFREEKSLMRKILKEYKDDMVKYARDEDKPY